MNVSLNQIKVSLQILKMMSKHRKREITKENHPRKYNSGKIEKLTI
jgi:hypothetical protein